MDVSLSELRELVMDRQAWRAVIHGVVKSQTRLSDWTELNTTLNTHLWKKVTFFPTKVNALGSAWLCDGHPAGIDDSLPDVYAQGLLYIREQGQGIS